MWRDGIFYDEGGEGGGGGNPPPASDPPQDDVPESFDAWIESQSDGIKALYNEHTTSLRNALASERNEKKDLARQLREASTQLEQGSQARQQLEEMSTKLETAEKYSTFLEESIAPDINCVRPKLAWMAMHEDNLTTRDGKPDWPALKQQYPELFRKQTPPPGNAGSGAGVVPPTTMNMNQIIRRSAGRTS